MRPHILRPKKCDHEWLEPLANGKWRCHFCWKAIEVDAELIILPPTSEPKREYVQ